MQPIRLRRFLFQQLSPKYGRVALVYSLHTSQECHSLHAALLLAGKALAKGVVGGSRPPSSR